MRLSLDGLVAIKTADLAQQFDGIATYLNAANRKENIVPAEQIETAVATLTTDLKQLFPPTWLESNAHADFDVLASVLDQMETAVVLRGVVLGVVAVLFVGMITFRLQTRLPYKQMLVWTGALIGLVLVTMVGKTVHVMQAVSWLPISPIRGLRCLMEPDCGWACLQPGREYWRR